MTFPTEKCRDRFTRSVEILVPDEDGPIDVTVTLEWERELEFVHESGLGLPRGTAQAVEDAFERLAERRVAGQIRAQRQRVDEETDEEKHYQIVGDQEADVNSGRISISSPIARALIGKEEGDSVEVRTPGGQRAYEILKIVYS